MSDSTTHEVQVLAATMQEINELFGLTNDFEPGDEVSLGQGMVVHNARVSRSSGFEGTQYLFEGVMTVAATTRSDLLAAWLRDRLKRNPKVSALVDGQEVRAGDSDPS